MRNTSFNDIYNAHERFFAGTASLASVVLIWELVGQLGMIDPIFFAWPSTIAQALYKTLSTGELYPHVWATFLELVWGFSLACLGIPLGILMGRSRTLEYLLDPLVSIFYAMPRIALMPLIIVILGIGVKSKIALVFLGCFFPILINVFQGMKNVDPLMVDMSKVFGARRMSLAVHVFIPSIMPYLLAGFRMAVGMGLVMAVVAEFFSGTEGIGYMIALEAGFYHTSALMAWVLVISGLAIFFTELIKYFENRWIYLSEFLG
jgi:ABC-type nitrate/sulfonate/bicarbonate transport system permease component